MSKLGSLIAGVVLTVNAGLALANGPLPELVAAGKRDQALALIAEGADVNALRADNTSALLYALHQGDLELSRALVEAGANVNQRNAYGATTLGEAAQAPADVVPLLKLLLEHGADPDLPNLEGETALMIAARAGNLEAAELLLSHGANIHAKEQWGGQTAIMWAAAQSQPAMLKLLIAHGANINEHGFARHWDRTILNEPRPKDMNKGGLNPILYAARQGCIDCIKVLAEAGANLDAYNPDRISALNLALINMHFDAAAVLIEVGADINHWDLFGRAPLYNAIDLHTLPTGGRTDIPSEDVLSGYDVAKLLLERGADPNMQLKLRPPYRNAVFDRGSDNPLANGATPLMRAARAADNESVKLLLSHGALVDLPNANGLTPLLVVAGVEWASEPTRGRYKTEEASIETISLLLEAGADINASSGDPARRRNAETPAGRNEGQTALHGAARQGWLKIAQFLIDSGIQQEVPDASGRTPFDLAMGRFPAGFLQAAPEPMLPMARLLQQNCENTAGCAVKDPVDFTR